LQTKTSTENHWVHLPKESLGSSPKITVSSSLTDFPSSSFDFLSSVVVVVFGVRFSSSRLKDLLKTQNTTMKIDPNISSYFSNPKEDPKNQQQNHTHKANPKINKKNKGKIWGNWTTIIPVGVNLLETQKADPFAVNLLQFLILDS
jgi:hypothetical protein